MYTKENSKTGSLKNKITTAFLWNTAYHPIRVALGLLTSVIVVRYLTKEEYGYYAVILAVISSLISYCELGTSQAIQKFIPEFKQWRGKREIIKLLFLICISKIIIFLVIFLTLIIFKESIVNYLKLPFQDIRILSIIYFITFLKLVSLIPSSLLISCFKQREANLCNVCYSILQPGFVIAFTILGYGVWGILIAIAFSELVYLILESIFSTSTLREISEEEKTCSEKIYFRVIKYCAASYYEKQMKYLISIPLLIILLNIYVEKSEIAIFSVASNLIIRLATNLFAPIGNLILPIFATVFTLRDQRKNEKAFMTVSRFLIFVFIPMSVLVFTSADLIIPVLYTAKYNESIIILKILSAFVFIDYIFFVPISTFLFANEKYRKVFLVRLLNILFIPLIIFIINRLNIAGVALIYGLFSLCSSLTLFIVSSKDIRISFPWTFLFRTTIPAIISGFFTKILSFNFIYTVPSLLYSISLFALFFVIIFKIFGGLEKEDKITLSEMKFPFKRYVLKIV